MAWLGPALRGGFLIMRTMPERDWKKLRAIRERALNRFCTRILTELKSAIDTAALNANAHKAYLDVYACLTERDKKVAHLFNDWRRSTAIFTLMAWVNAGVVTAEEFESLSDETKETVRAITDVEFFEE
jgi:hypothetical protein